MSEKKYTDPAEEMHAMLTEILVTAKSSNAAVYVCDSICCQEQLRETDFAKLTVKEVIERITEFIKQEPDKLQTQLFLTYLSYYPVSMCKRDVSPLLKSIIGIQYLGTKELIEEMNKERKADDPELKTISYEDLCTVFMRSKATISEYVTKGKVTHAKYIEQETETHCLHDASDCETCKGYRTCQDNEKAVIQTEQ
jgi:hypothetical protein